MGQPQQTSPSFQQQMTLPNQTAAALASAQPQSQERRVDRASREIGQYLLRGWTLTDEPCPSASCGVPLMRSRDRQWLCVLCGSVPDPSAPISSQQSTRLHSVTTSTSIPPADHISLRPQSTIDDLDAELMQDIERQRTLIRERERVERERDQPVMNSSEHPSSTPTVSEAPTSSDQERRRQSDRASSLIGQKLLQGWALLNDSCPSSSCYGIPLVRNQDRKALCVICETYYQKEDTDATWNPVAHPSASTTPPSVVATVPETRVAQSSLQTGISRAVPASPQVPLSSSQPQSIASPSVAAPHSSHTNASSLGASLSPAIAALQNKISEYSRILETCPTGNVDLVRSHTKMIRELVETLEIVKRVGAA